MISEFTVMSFILLFILIFKDMSGKDELRRIREELEKMNKKSD